MRGVAASAMALLGLVLAARSASAQTGPRATVAVTAGYNSITTPLSFPSTSSNQGPFATLSTAIGDTFQTARGRHNLGLTFSGYVPFSQSFTLSQNPVRYSAGATYLTAYELSSRLRVIAGLRGAFTPLNTFNPNSGAASTQLLVTPVGYRDNVSGSASIALPAKISPKGTLTPAEHFSTTIPINSDPIAARLYALDSSLTYATNLSLERFSIIAGSTYSHFDISETQGGGVVDPRTTFLNRALLAWSHAWTPQVTTTLRAGILNVLTDTSVVGSSFYQPNGAAQLAYRPLYGRTTLTYSHAGGINAITAQVTLTDQVALRGAFPLGKNTDLFAVGGGGFSYTQAISTTGALVSPVQIFLIDAGVTWRPKFLPRFAIGVRESWRQQTPTQNPIGALTHQTTAFTITYAYPNALLVGADVDLPDDADESGLSASETGATEAGVDEDAPDLEQQEAGGTGQTPPGQPAPGGAPAPAPTKP